MSRPGRSITRSTPRLTLCLALALAAWAAAGCGGASKATAPIVTAPGAPAPMVTVVGDPHGNVTLTGYMFRPSATDTTSGYFYLTITDSVNHPQFATDVTMNGLAMRAELDALGQPWRYSLLPTDLGIGFQPGDTLHIAVDDTNRVTGSFTLRVVPSSMQLPGDGATISQAKDLILTWNGAAETVLVSLIDKLGYRVRANLQFQNESGINQLLIRSQDLKPMEQGTLVVSTDLVNGEQRLTPRSKLLTTSMTILDNRHWNLVP